eukprot:s1855_g8.t1
MFRGGRTVGVVREADSLQGDLFHYVALWLIRAPPRKGWRLWQTPFAISCLEKPRRSRKQRRSPQHRRKHERPASGRSSGCGSRKPRDGDNAKKGRHERRPDDRNGRDNFRLPLALLPCSAEPTWPAFSQMILQGGDSGAWPWPRAPFWASRSSVWSWLRPCRRFGQGSRA